MAKGPPSTQSNRKLTQAPDALSRSRTIGGNLSCWLQAGTIRVRRVGGPGAYTLPLIGGNRSDRDLEADPYFGSICKLLQDTARTAPKPTDWAVTRKLWMSEQRFDLSDGLLHLSKMLLVHVRVPRTFGKRLDDSNRLPVSLGHRPNVRLSCLPSMNHDRSLASPAHCAQRFGTSKPAPHLDPL
jgi:hypothetical protein